MTDESETFSNSPIITYQYRDGLIDFPPHRIPSIHSGLRLYLQPTRQDVEDILFMADCIYWSDITQAIKLLAPQNPVYLLSLKVKNKQSGKNTKK